MRQHRGCTQDRVVSRCAGTAALALWLLVPAGARAGARLGSDVRPVSITVALDLDPAREGYTGTVRAEIEVAARIERFRLHARDLTVTAARLRGPAGESPARTEKIGNDQIAIVPATPLAPGRYTLALEFRNEYGRRAASLYRVETGGNSYLFTQFEATEARGAFPCWDEPEFKIPWQMTLTVPKGDLAIGNTPIERESAAGGNRKKVVFLRTKPLPSYLIAIAVGPFETVPIRGMSIPGRVVCVKGASALAAEAARVTPPILASLERYFGRAYPFEKLDLIAAPEFLYGAMENAGAIVFADRRLLIDPLGGAAADRRSLRSVVAHELAHMWFGDLVTMRWWDDLWLNESFATWMGTKAMDEVFPEYRSGLAGYEGSHRAIEIDSHASTRAMRQPIESEDNLSANANDLTYNKGRSVLAMFEGWLGEARFRAGVLDYLAAHAWSNATGNDLWTAISQASGDDINAAMSSFLDQGGVPIVTVEPLAGGLLRIRQRRFLTSGAAADPPALWRIPVILGLPDGRTTKQQRVWLADSVLIVPLDGNARPAWILPNSGARGYYAWDVPRAMLAAMAADRGRLTSDERVGFVRNLLALLRAGRLPVEDYLPLLARFRDDAEPEVISAVIDGLQAVREPLVPSELEALYAQQVRQILHPVSVRIGSEPRPRELAATSVTRPKLLRALGDMGMDPEVRSWADATTARVLAGGAEDPSLAEAALQLSARRGGPRLAAQFRSRFERATTPGDRQLYLDALGNFRDPTVLDSLLDYTLSGLLRPQEVVALPARLAEWPANRDLLYRWLSGRYDRVLQHIPGHMVSRLMPIVRGCSRERLAQARTFFADPAHTFPGARPVIERTGESVEDCVRLARRDGARFAEFLRSAAGSP